MPAVRFPAMVFALGTAVLTYWLIVKLFHSDRLALGLALLNWAGPLMVAIEPDPARAVADFHTLFNLATAALFLPVLGPLARLLVRMLPARAVPADPSRPIYLDEAARETPVVALAEAWAVGSLLESWDRVA